MKRYIYIAYALILALAACQDDKLGDHGNSGNATLTLSFNSSGNTLSRAVSSDEDEQIISNAYVFVFNQDGSKVFGQFNNNIIKNLHDQGWEHSRRERQDHSCYREHQHDDSRPEWHKTGCSHLESRFVGTDIAHAGRLHRERNPVSDERNERRSRVNSKPK